MSRADRDGEYANLNRKWDRDWSVSVAAYNAEPAVPWKCGMTFWTNLSVRLGRTEWAVYRAFTRRGFTAKVAAAAAKGE